jgi:hypothetical protein
MKNSEKPDHTRATALEALPRKLGKEGDELDGRNPRYFKDS